MISRAFATGAIRIATIVFFLVGAMGPPALASVYLGRIGSQPLGQEVETFRFQVVVDGEDLGGTGLESASFRLLPDGEFFALDPLLGARCRWTNCFIYSSGSYATAEERDLAWPDGDYEIQVTVNGTSGVASIPVSSESVPNPDAGYEILYPLENPSTLPENSVLFSYESPCQNCEAGFEAEIAQDLSVDDWEVLFKESLEFPSGTWVPPSWLVLEQEVPYRFSVYALNQEAGSAQFSGDLNEVLYQVYSDRGSQVDFTVPEPSAGLLQGAALGVVVWLAATRGRGRRAEGPRGRGRAAAEAVVA